MHMKMTIQIIILLTVFGLIAGFVIKNRNQENTNENKTENNVLLINGKPILKQFRDFKPNDFDNYPVWVQCHLIDYDEKWYDDTDEETFGPWIDNIPVSPDFAMFLIKADLKLSDGERYSGFITPCMDSDYQNENSLGLIQPQIFTKIGERIGFWTGMFPNENSEIDRFYKLMDKTQDQIFPIEFKAKDGLSNGVTSGKINGFLTIGENKNIMITK